MNAGGVDKACKSNGRLCFTMFSTNSLNSKIKNQNAKLRYRFAMILDNFELLIVILTFAFYILNLGEW